MSLKDSRGGYGRFWVRKDAPDMFYNCNEEIKRQKEQTIRNQNMLTGRICDRDRGRIRTGLVVAGR